MPDNISEYSDIPSLLLIDCARVVRIALNQFKDVLLSL